MPTHKNKKSRIDKDIEDEISKSSSAGSAESYSNTSASTINRKLVLLYFYQVQQLVVRSIKTCVPITKIIIKYHLLMQDYSSTSMT